MAKNTRRQDLRETGGDSRNMGDSKLRKVDIIFGAKPQKYCQQRKSFATNVSNSAIQNSLHLQQAKRQQNIKDTRDLQI